MKPENVLKYIVFCLALATLTSCKQERIKNNGKILVDYKRDTYKISLGDNYKRSAQYIEWQWAALSDNDDKIDSTGVDDFLCLGEPLLQYNNCEWLPTLHITTFKNKITQFKCSILFELENKPNAINDFLLLISRNIKRLHNKKIVHVIITTGEFKIRKANYIESYKLTKGKENNYDAFVYTIKFISK